MEGKKALKLACAEQALWHTCVAQNKASAIKKGPVQRLRDSISTQSASDDYVATESLMLQRVPRKFLDDGAPEGRNLSNGQFSNGNEVCFLTKIIIWRQRST